jgi:hypothetical protein
MSRLRVGWLFAVALAGCDPGPQQVDASSPTMACGRAFDRMRACEGRDEKAVLDRERDSEIERCVNEPFGHPEDYRALAECAGRAGCEEFRECALGVARRVEHRSTMVGILGTLRNRKAGDVAIDGLEGDIGTCIRYAAESTELAALCDELYEAARADYRRELRDLRDGGASVGRERCKVRQDSANRMPAPAGEEVRALCEEIEAGLEASATLSNVALAKAYETEAVPASCAETIERLGRLATPWARDRRDEVVRECYVEYGRSLLPRLIARKRCREIGEMVPHLSPLAAEDRALAKMLARAERACPAMKEAK